MTILRSHLSALLAASALAGVACSPALAQGSDRMPGGVERAPSIDMQERRLRSVAPPPPAPAPSAPAAASPAAPSTSAPADGKTAPGAGEPKPAESKPTGKKSKKSSKGGTNGSRAYESAPVGSGAGPGGDDRRVGGVERAPTPSGSQP